MAGAATAAAAPAAEHKKVLPKLFYFPINARAEFIKVLYEDAGAEYEFVPVQFGEQKTMSFLPFGQLPVLQLPCGTCIAQTGAIVRTVAKQLNLYPSNPADAARAEAVNDQVSDVVGQCGSHFFTGKPSLDDIKTYLTAQYANFEKILAASESKGEFVLKHHSFADLTLFQLLLISTNLQPTTAGTLLHALFERVKARPGIAAFLASPRWIKPGPPPSKSAPKAEAPKA